MSQGAYIPDAGDIVWIDLDPRIEREKSGHRPAVVLSPATYNSRVGLMLCCPATTRIKGYPFEVRLNGSPPNVVLADQVKSVDWRKRSVQLKGRTSAAELSLIRVKLRALIGT